MFLAHSPRPQSRAFRRRPCPCRFPLQKGSKARRWGLGRAGHQVGATSRGVIFPKFRGDLVTCAVVTERMLTGQIESLRIPRNPLDVLAQQIIAMVAMTEAGGEEWTVDECLALAMAVEL